jgi:hypothetical protein
VGFTEDLDSNLQPLSNEEICDFAEQLTEQQKEDEDEVIVEPKQWRRRAVLIFFPL